MDYDDDEGVHRLEGSKHEIGGLIIKKKPVAGANFEFKLPKTSLLGLDKLAGTGWLIHLGLGYLYDLLQKV